MPASRLTEAIEHLQAAHRMIPDRADWATVLAHALLVAGEFREAEAVLQACVGQRGSSPRVSFLLACSWLLAGRYEEAESWAEALTRGSSAFWRAWALLALARAGRDDLDGALDALERTMVLTPGAVAPRLRMGAWILRRRVRDGGPPLADTERVRAVLEGLGDEARYLEGCTEEVAGDPRLARARYESCAQAERPEVRLRRARCLLLEGEAPRARVLIEGVANHSQDFAALPALRAAAERGRLTASEVPSWAPDESFLPVLGLLNQTAEEAQDEITQSFPISPAAGVPMAPAAEAEEGEAS